MVMRAAKAGQKSLGPRRTESIVANPKDLRKLHSDPNQRLGNIGDIVSGRVGWAQIPTYYYDYRTLDFPLSDSEFDSQTSVQNVFNCGDDSLACGRVTNALCGSGINEPFIACGLCIIAIGEGEAFATNGVVVPTSQGCPDLPLATGLCEKYCGVVDTAAAAALGVTATPAQLWWGGPTWRFIEKYFQMFQLELLIQRRFLYVQESLMDIGMCPVPPEFVGASCSEITTQPFIREVNDVLACKGVAQHFLTANRGGSDSTLCLPPPLEGVTYGSPRIVGLSNRLYTFPTPILMLPGMRWDLQFVPVEDADCVSALRNTSTFNCITQSESCPVVCPPGDLGGSCGAVCTIPGGQVRLGVVLKGFSLWPNACIDFINNMLYTGSIQAQALAGLPYMYEVMKKYENHYDAKSKDRLFGILGRPQI